MVEQRLSTYAKKILTIPQSRKLEEFQKYGQEIQAFFLQQKNRQTKLQTRNMAYGNL